MQFQGGAGEHRPVVAPGNHRKVVTPLGSQHADQILNSPDQPAGVRLQGLVDNTDGPGLLCGVARLVGAGVHYRVRSDGGRVYVGGGRHVAGQVPIEVVMAGGPQILVCLTGVYRSRRRSLDGDHGRGPVEGDAQHVGGGVAVVGNVHDAVDGDHGSHLAVGVRRQGEREVLVGRGMGKVRGRPAGN